MFFQNTRNLIIVGVIAAVCGLAAIGFLYRPASQPVGSAAFVSGQPVTYGSAPIQPQIQPVQPVYASDGYYPATQRPVYVRQQYAEPVTVQPEYVGQGGTRVVRQRDVYERPAVRRGRSKTHSVEIVAGTAAAGAIIGALAGGGKGAAIGGASGAGAGFVYDRLTHNH